MEKKYPNIDPVILEKLEKVAAIWKRRYVTIQKITFFQSIDQKKPYYLVFDIPSTDVSSGLTDWYTGIKPDGVMGKELMGVYVHGDAKEFLKKWKVFTHVTDGEDIYIDEGIIDAPNGSDLKEKCLTPDTFISKIVPGLETVLVHNSSNKPHSSLQHELPSDLIRSQEKELETWNEFIRPIVHLHYNGRIKYKYFKTPEIITNEDLNNMMKREMFIYYNDKYEPLFPKGENKSETKGMLLWFQTGQTHRGDTNLKELYFSFLLSLFTDGTLPIYLKLVELECGEDVFNKNSIKHTRENKKELEMELEELLKNYCPELEHFYRGWVQDLSLLGEERDSSPATKLKDTAVDYFLRDSETHTYNFLQKENVCDEYFYRFTVNPRKSMIGSILKKIIERELEDVWNHKNIDTRIDKLMKLHNKFK